jgi:hypothetical protein
VYLQASEAEDPSPEESELHLVEQCDPPEAPSGLDLGESCRMLDAVNKIFHHALEELPDVGFFGEDIAVSEGRGVQS